MSALNDKTILVGVSGGIAAYKICTLVSGLVKSGARVHVVMTKNATEFVSPLTFETLSGNRVVVDMFDRDFPWEVEHVSLAKQSDAAILAPATANVIAKLACGIADDFLTTTFLACRCPIIIARAMNTAMLENQATVHNIDVLLSRGIKAVYGGEGRLACGDSGAGRMAEADELLKELEKLFCRKQDLAGKTVLVTAGATRVDIDPVRYLTNRSSGKMGYAIARAAFERGAKVVYIHGFTDKSLAPDAEWKSVAVTTTEELLEAVKANVGSADIAVMAAAPCDYTIKKSENKIKSDKLDLELEKAPDCAAWVGKNKGKTKLVVFAAETENGEENASNKLRAKNADLAVLNDVTERGAGFDVDTNIVTFIAKDGTKRLPIMKKRELADEILNKILSI